MVSRKQYPPPAPPPPWEADEDTWHDVVRHGEQYLNMQLFGDERDRELMAIAYDSLRAHDQLPDGWDRDFTEDGMAYYWHHSWPEERTQWEHPDNADFAKAIWDCGSRLMQQGAPGRQRRNNRRQEYDDDSRDNRGGRCDGREGRPRRGSRTDSDRNSNDASPRINDGRGHGRGGRDRDRERGGNRRNDADGQYDAQFDQQHNENGHCDTGERRDRRQRYDEGRDQDRRDGGDHDSGRKAHSGRDRGGRRDEGEKERPQQLWQQGGTDVTPVAGCKDPTDNSTAAAEVDNLPQSPPESPSRNRSHGGMDAHVSDVDESEEEIEEDEEELHPVEADDAETFHDYYDDVPPQGLGTESSANNEDDGLEDFEGGDRDEGCKHSHAFGIHVDGNVSEEGLGGATTTEHEYAPPSPLPQQVRPPTAMKAGGGDYNEEVTFDITLTEMSLDKFTESMREGLVAQLAVSLKVGPSQVVVCAVQPGSLKLKITVKNLPAQAPNGGGGSRLTTGAAEVAARARGGKLVPEDVFGPSRVSSVQTAPSDVVAGTSETVSAHTKGARAMRGDMQGLLDMAMRGDGVHGGEPNSGGDDYHDDGSLEERIDASDNDNVDYEGSGGFEESLEIPQISSVVKSEAPPAEETLIASPGFTKMTRNLTDYQKERQRLLGGDAHDAIERERSKNPPHPQEQERAQEMSDTDPDDATMLTSDLLANEIEQQKAAAPAVLQHQLEDDLEEEDLDIDMDEEEQQREATSGQQVEQQADRKAAEVERCRWRQEKAGEDNRTLQAAQVGNFAAAKVVEQKRLGKEHCDGAMEREEEQQWKLNEKRRQLQEQQLQQQQELELEQQKNELESLQEQAVQPPVLATAEEMMMYASGFGSPESHRQHMQHVQQAMAAVAHGSPTSHQGGYIQLPPQIGHHWKAQQIPTPGSPQFRRHSSFGGSVQLAAHSPKPAQHPAQLSVEVSEAVEDALAEKRKYKGLLDEKREEIHRLEESNDKLDEELQKVKRDLKKQARSGLTAKDREQMEEGRRQLQLDLDRSRIEEEQVRKEVDRERGMRLDTEQELEEKTKRLKRVQDRLEMVSDQEEKNRTKELALQRQAHEQDQNLAHFRMEAMAEAQKDNKRLQEEHRGELNRLKNEHARREAGLTTDVETASKMAAELRLAKAREKRALSASKIAAGELETQKDLAGQLQQQLDDAHEEIIAQRREVVTLKANEGPAYSALGVLQQQYDSLARKHASREEALVREVVILRGRCDTLEREQRDSTRTAQQRVSEAEAARAGAVYASQRTEERLASADAARHAIAQRLAVAESDARDAAAAAAQARADGRHAEQRLETGVIAPLREELQRSRDEVTAKIGALRAGEAREAAFVKRAAAEAVETKTDVRRRLADMAAEASDAARAEWQKRMAAAVDGAREAAQAKFGEAATAAQRQALEISELSVQLRQALEDETEARAAAEARALAAEGTARDLEKTLRVRIQAAEAAGEAQRRRESADGAVGGAALSAISQNLNLLQSECSQLIIESGIAPHDPNMNIGNDARGGTALSTYELATETSELRRSGSFNDKRPHQHQRPDQITKSLASIFDSSTMAASDSPLRPSKVPPDWTSPRFSDGECGGGAREGIILEEHEPKNEVKVVVMTTRAAGEHNSAALRQRFNFALDKGNAATVVAAVREARLLDQSVGLFENGNLSTRTAHAAKNADVNMPVSSSSSSSSSMISMGDLSENALQPTLPRCGPITGTSLRPPGGAGRIAVGPELISPFQQGVWIARYGGPPPHGRA